MTEDVPADSVTDLKTTDNTLSVWLIDDQHANLDRILAAFAGTRQRPDPLDYALFNTELLVPIPIEARKCEGKTDDDVANDCHYDLIELSGMKLIGLAKVILKNCECVRILPKKVSELIQASIDAGYMPKRD